MAAPTRSLPEAKWLVNLLVSAAVGTGAYAMAVFAIGLKPGERGTVFRLVGKVISRGGPNTPAA